MAKQIGLVIGGVAASAFGTITLLAHTDLPAIPPVGYLALGIILLFVASFRAYHDVRVSLVGLQGREDARKLAGLVELAPVLMPVDREYLPNGDPIGVYYRAGVLIKNRGTSGIRYRVQRFDARLEGDVRLQGDSGSSYPVSPADYMQGGGPAGFGPWGLGTFLECEFVVEVRIALPFATSTVVEQRRFEFLTNVFDNGNRAQAPDSYTAAGGSEHFVPANIDDDTADWTINGALPAPVSTGGPMRTVATVPIGADPNEAFGITRELRPIEEMPGWNDVDPAAERKRQPKRTSRKRPQQQP